jgi:hypothetical protein
MPHPKSEHAMAVSDSRILLRYRTKYMKAVILLSRPLTVPAVEAAALLQVKTQVTDYFRSSVSNFEVTALFDGYSINATNGFPCNTARINALTTCHC